MPFEHAHICWDLVGTILVLGWYKVRDLRRGPRERERDKERKREREKGRKRERQKERKREREKERKREREREREGPR